MIDGFIDGYDRDYDTDGEAVYDPVTGEEIGYLDDDMVILNDGTIDWAVDIY